MGITMLAGATLLRQAASILRQALPRFLEVVRESPGQS